MIADALKDDSERKDAIKKGGSIFGFTLKNGEGNTESWYIDLKETGTVGKGAAPEGKKAAGTFDTDSPRELRDDQESHGERIVKQSCRAWRK